MKKKIAVLISGRGSNMKALLDFSLNDGRELFSVDVVISNRSDAPGLKIAKSYGVETHIYQSEAVMLEVLSKRKVDLVCLAGFMKVLSERFISHIGCSIINIHPSLLPSFRGTNAQTKALAAGVKIAGCTVHYVIPEVDAGEIIVQGAVPVFEDDTVESLSKRILKVEHKCFPIAIKNVLTNKKEKNFVFSSDCEEK